MLRCDIPNNVAFASNMLKKNVVFVATALEKLSKRCMDNILWAEELEDKLAQQLLSSQSTKNEIMTELQAIEKLLQEETFEIKMAKIRNSDMKSEAKKVDSLGLILCEVMKHVDRDGTLSVMDGLMEMTTEKLLEKCSSSIGVK